MELLYLGFPYSFIFIGIGFFIGICITGFIFGSICVGLFIIMIYFDMIRIFPLIQQIQKILLFLFPQTISNLRKRIKKTFSLENTAPVIDSPSLFLFHPHGIFSAGVYYHTLTKETSWPYQGKLAILSRLFSLPFIREIFTLYDVVPNEYDAMKNVLEKGEHLYVVPGGVKEMFSSSKQYQLCVHIKKRNGVFRMALETGTQIVPVLSYGENELFEYVKIPFLHSFLQQFSIPLPIPSIQSVWKWIQGKNNPIQTYIGEPIIVEKQEATEEAISSLREKYIQHLQRLYIQTKPNEYEKELCIE